MLEESKMPAIAANVQDRIVSLVKTILDRNAIAAEVLPESRLVDMGLTSMDMVNLMLSVEAEFDLTLPQCDITPENFRSVQMIERMIGKQLQPGATLS
jgi:acyl carrier protein